LHHKVQKKISSGIASPAHSWKYGRKMVVRVCVFRPCFDTNGWLTGRASSRQKTGPLISKSSVLEEVEKEI